MYNPFYEKNKDCPDKKCYEVASYDNYSHIRFSKALTGTRRAAENALERYLVLKNPEYMFRYGPLPAI